MIKVTCVNCGNTFETAESGYDKEATLDNWCDDCMEELGENYDN